ncbi:L,D-transpeptidase family protein [Sphaerotilus microaerophilus]|nr:L,D-transpeptidase family protein [Sphaerotilus sp. FB-5]
MQQSDRFMGAGGARGAQGALGVCCRFLGRRRFLALLGGLWLGLAGPACQAQPASASPWFDAGRPSARSHEALALLADAPSHGLRAEDYGLAALHEAVAQAGRQPADAATADALARALDAALRAYLGDLREGRVDPRQLHHDFEPPRRDPAADPAVLLQAALARGRLAEAVRDATPRLPQYEQLRGALARYRSLAGHPAWQQPLPKLPAAQRGRPRTLEPGGDYAGLARLAERLIALGDLAAADAAPWLAPAAPSGAASAAVSAPPHARYEGALLAAVQAFQTRHGLGADGRLGRATLAQLEVPPAARARQIELALERLRWTPALYGPRMIVVNVPEFVLRAYEVAADGRIELRLAMKVIVGQALRTQTPLLDEELRSIELSPYWNVPPSIARQELVPELRRSPGVWAREGYEFVAAGAAVATALTEGGLDAVLAGHARIRQRPGPRNALGTIKFVFPNRESVYLHDTSAPGLFGRERRDFSHGCIRIEQPLALARLVLRGQPEGDEAWLREALAGGRNTHVRVAQPWQVLIAYGTALVKEGRVFFFDDIYGHDRALDAALQRPRLASPRGSAPAPVVSPPAARP